MTDSKAEFVIRHLTGCEKDVKITWVPVVEIHPKQDAVEVMICTEFHSGGVNPHYVLVIPSSQVLVVSKVMC